MSFSAAASAALWQDASGVSQREFHRLEIFIKPDRIGTVRIAGDIRWREAELLNYLLDSGRSQPRKRLPSSANAAVASG